MKMELKTLVGASLSEEAINEVNNAMVVLMRTKLAFPANVALSALQKNLFDIVPIELNE